MPTTQVANFEPKQSQRVGSNLKNMKGDGDIWLERIAHDKKGRKRSFFQSVKNNVCVWDEPPSGAANIVLADQVEKLPHFKKYRSLPPPASTTR